MSGNLIESFKLVSHAVHTRLDKIDLYFLNTDAARVTKVENDVFVSNGELKKPVDRILVLENEKGLT